MGCRFFRSALAFCLLAMGASPALATTPRASPVLQLSGNDFPDLVVHQPVFDENGGQLALACDQIRAKRIDELDPPWRQAVDRIHLDCDDLSRDEAGADMVSTVITAYLKPGAAQFDGVPVVEVRLMDSDLWSDHQYLLDQPCDAIRASLKRHLESRCHAQQDDPSLLVRHDCKVVENESGLYLDRGEAGGIWIHAEQENPARTIYAESWAD